MAIVMPRVRRSTQRPYKGTKIRTFRIDDDLWDEWLELCVRGENGEEYHKKTGYPVERLRYLLKKDIQNRKQAISRSRPEFPKDDWSRHSKNPV